MGLRLGGWHRHVQTPGVETCLDSHGSCRVPIITRTPRSYIFRCPPGFWKKKYEDRCDSGCGYWWGRCGQVCCVPSTNASFVADDEEEELHGSLEHGYQFETILLWRWGFRCCACLFCIG